MVNLNFHMCELPTFSIKTLSYADIALLFMDALFHADRPYNYIYNGILNLTKIVPIEKFPIFNALVNKC